MEKEKNYLIDFGLPNTFGFGDSSENIKFKPKTKNYFDDSILNNTNKDKENTFQTPKINFYPSTQFFKNNSISRKSRIEILTEKQKQLNKIPQNNSGTNLTSEKRKIDISNIKINLKEKLELSDTFFGNLKNGEIFIYSNNTLYKLNSQENEEGYFLNYKGRSFGLEKSEDLIKLESNFLEKNRENIKRFQTKNLDNLSKQYNDLRRNFLSLKQKINNRFSIEEFISDYVFTLYNRRKISPKKMYKDINLSEEDLSKKIEIGEINFSDLKKSVLENLAENISKEKNKNFGGLVVLCGNIYGVLPLSNSTNQKTKKEISLDNSFYICSMQEIDLRYKEKLSKEINRRVKENFYSAILKIEEGKEKIRELNSDGRKRIIKNREGDIGFEKKSNNEYLVFKDLPRYIIKKNGEHYPFPSVRIGTRITCNGGGLSFQTKGDVLTSGYEHPFVYYDGSICYGDSGGHQKEILGVKRSNYGLNNLNKKQFAIDVLKVLDFTEEVLTKGYDGNPTPVHPISSFREIDREEANRLARRGIKIFDNN